MGTYRPLLSIHVDHGFYAGGTCRDLRFAPCAETAAWLHGRGCVSRDTGSGIVVYAEEGAMAQWDKEPLPPLVWLVRSEDPFFANFTEGLPQASDELLFFDGERAFEKGADGTWRLRDRAGNPRRDFYPLQWPALVRALSARDRRVPPCFLVRIALEDRAARGDDGARFRIRFEARATIWKYWLLGYLSTEKWRIVDPGNQAVFDTLDLMPLYNGQKALPIRSQAGIPLRERSEFRFQLVAGDKVLVKPLPVASNRHLTRETIGGEQKLVSEIYVHR